ncbi:MAG: nicotinate (nicotinamide) nucleotide adenylyltransferase [Candidatus Marinimicrobia bacterium]|nr:nicotinate (nicotinamide) nucleotide adenylyltransferase [Candidatus Neomarinimicrobiota bacterium]MBL7010041.1 nicotinate (nicotinamide) nucleotide adenylyltransferase [Candidatus Neomarinimicrobiota bacterium]MBL7030310.1 nicotinate (nicotinamide) nucleotide adenylyltransferase [Candidatus Neomarinimicrobiota bacterium]
MKTCLFGGTFDPPHFGHLIVAQTIFEAEHFDKIVFVPAHIPPHKKERKISSVELRLEMLKIATMDNPNFEISDIELKRGGISYSLETIQTYKEQTGLGRGDLYYLIGSDSLKQFQTWQNPKAILDECQLIVAIRPGFRPSDIPNWILAKVQFANIPRIEISSTQIRARWVKDKTIRYMVTQPVWTFINKYNLY